MQIEQKNHKEIQDSDDSWDPQQQNFDQRKPSLFQKITVKFDDRTIQKNIDAECQNPILNSNLFPLQDQEQNQEMDCQQTTEQNVSKRQHPKISQKISMQTESDKKQNLKNKRNQTQNQEALFDVIQDQQNESWMRKKVKNSIDKVGNKKQQRPLTCPQCFTQVCFVYELIKQGQKFKFTQQETPEGKNQKKYRTKVVENIIVHEHRVIRNRFCSQNMQKKSNRTVQNLEKLYKKDLQVYENELKTRYEDINVKILISCEGCGLQLGFWDVNQQAYILCNVI